MAKHERFLQLLLRIIGGAALLAIPCAVMPYEWMDATHRWLGLGEMPSEPIVGYLARSTSAFYALLGGLLWTISWDLRRHRLVLCYLGYAVIVFGAFLFAVDWLEGMPHYWVWGEGPFTVVFGVLILWSSRRLDSAEARA